MRRTPISGQMVLLYMSDRKVLDSDISNTMFLTWMNRCKRQWCQEPHRATLPSQSGTRRKCQIEERDPVRLEVIENGKKSDLRIVNPLSSGKDFFSTHEHVVAVAVPIGRGLVTSHSSCLFKLFSVTLHLWGLALYRRVAPDEISRVKNNAYVLV